jgi:hypothetical protein
MPIPRSADRGLRIWSSNPFNELVNTASADRMPRLLSTGAQPTRGWDVAHAEVEAG